MSPRIARAVELLPLFSVRQILLYSQNKRKYREGNIPSRPTNYANLLASPDRKSYILKNRRHFLAMTKESH